jgi:hypothetical protein
MRALVLLMVMACGLWADDHIGGIEFFGYKGLDVDAARRALPVHVGDRMTGPNRQRIIEAVRQAIGVRQVRVNDVCCDPEGRTWVYISLPGKSSVPFRYLPEPTGSARLSPELVALMKKRDKALYAAIEKGGDAPQEDDSAGYALTHDPASRALDLQLREYALHHEEELAKVLETSSDAEHRGMAATGMGYAKQSRAQLDALLKACRDPADGVRNDATRALGVLARSSESVGAQIDPSVFIDMIRSDVWTDRNKSSGVLTAITSTRDAEVLRTLQDQCGDALLEMAGWHEVGFALGARVILGRIAGIEEAQVWALAMGPPEPFLVALSAFQ